MALFNKTPASIKYLSANSRVNEIRFHGVVSEGHKTSTQLTKYPVQSGFVVTNHAITQNRKVTLVGLISDVILMGSNSVSYSTTSPTAEVFKVLNQLVLNKVPCRVVTNLGVYDPVIFTSADSSQGVGAMNIMQVTMSGEELQIADDTVRNIITEVNLQPIAKAVGEGYKDGLGFSATIKPDGGLSYVFSKAKEVSKGITENKYADGFMNALGGSSLKVDNEIGKKETYTVNLSELVAKTRLEEGVSTGSLSGVGPTTEDALITSELGTFEFSENKGSFQKTIDASVVGKEAGVPQLFSDPKGAALGYLKRAAASATTCLVDSLVGDLNDSIQDSINTIVTDLTGSATGLVREAIGGSILGDTAADCIIVGAKKGSLVQPKNSEGNLIDSTGKELLGLDNRPMEQLGFPQGKDIISGFKEKGLSTVAGIGTRLGLENTEAEEGVDLNKFRFSHLRPNGALSIVEDRKGEQITRIKNASGIGGGLRF
jgi:hypothetical protein